VEEIMSILLELLGLFFGVFSRTWIPYLRKLKQGRADKFNKKYLHQAIGSAILALISVLLILPKYTTNSINVVDFFTGIKVFATAFAFGFGWNAVVNEAVSWKEMKVNE
jgi:hypothetical protein